MLLPPEPCFRLLSLGIGCDCGFSWRQMDAKDHKLLACCSRNLNKPARYDGKYLSYLTGLKEFSQFQDVCAVFFQAVAVKGFVSFVHAAVAVGGFRGGAGGWAGWIPAASERRVGVGSPSGVFL